MVIFIGIILTIMLVVNVVVSIVTVAALVRIQEETQDISRVVREIDRVNKLSD